jgi:type IV secretory pathway VirB4 component
MEGCAVSNVIRVLKLNELRADKGEGLPTPQEEPSTGSWDEICPLASFPGLNDDDGLIVLDDGSMRKVISCKGINALLFDEAERELLARQFAALANSCESDLQIIVTSRNCDVDNYLTRYHSSIETSNEYLKWYSDYTDKWFRRVQEVHFVPQREFYVVVTYGPPNDEVSQPEAGSLAKPSADDVELLERRTRMVMEQLRGSNLFPSLLNRKAVRDLLYWHLNPSLAETDKDAPEQRAGVSEMSTLVHSALKIYDSHIKLDNKYVGTQYMRELPYQTWMGWLVDLLRVSNEYSLSLFLHCCDQDKVRGELRSKYSASNKKNGDPQVASTAEGIRQFLSSSNKAFDVSLYIRSQADSTEHLMRSMDEIRRIFTNRGAILDRAQMVQLEAWRSTLPLAIDKLAVVHRIGSDVVGTFWPFFTARCGTPNGVPFGFAVASREPVLLNPFYRGGGKDANNMLVSGAAGAGTSFAITKMLLRLLPFGVHTVLIDQSHSRFGSYRFLTKLLGADCCQYLELDSPGVCLNPFDIGVDDPVDTSTGPSSTKMRWLLSLLDIMLAADGQNELSLYEKSLLDGWIRAAYIEASSCGTVPTMSDLANIAVKESTTGNHKGDQIRSLSQSLLLFTTKGPFGGFIDGQTTINTGDSLFTVFDTRLVNDRRLESVSLFMLTNFIKQKAAEYRLRGIRFASIFEEAEVVIRTKIGAQCLDDLSRSSRQYGMMHVVVVKQLADFCSQSKIADSVMKRADIKLILRQHAGDLELLKEKLRLSDAEVTAIENFGKDAGERRDAQAVLMVGETHGTVRLVPSPMDYWICTSEPIKDIPQRQRMIADTMAKRADNNETDATRQAVFYLGLEST